MTVKMAKPTAHPAARIEREITRPVDMCGPDGRLNVEAVGWSRRPLHRANLKGWGRNKRFEYWCIITPEFLITANVSHHDYRANVASTFIDLVTHDKVAYRQNVWLPPTGTMADPLSRDQVVGVGRDIAVKLVPNDLGTHIVVTSPRMQAEIQAFEEPDRESMGVLVPWDNKRFQYTRKDNCVPVSGFVIVDGKRRELHRDTALAIHDHGRGRWPYDTWWNWGAGGGVTDGVQIGLNFGAKWTDGTASTENAIRIDGRIHKISEDLVWQYDRTDWLRPWTISGQRVRVTFTPQIYHHHAFDRVIVSALGDQCFGVFNGEVVADDGRIVPIRDIYGLVEEVHRKW
jgi:hypothetical protein